MMSLINRLKVVSDNLSQSPGRERWYLGALSLPMIALGSLFAFGFWQESRAKHEVDTVIAQFKQRGEAIGNESLRVLFDEQTDKDVAARWQRIADAAQSLESSNYVELNDATVDDLYRLVPPGEPWAVEPVLERYGQQAGPVLEEIKTLINAENPTWSPVVFEGFETSLPDLQDVRVIARLISHVARDAYHRGDHQKTIETLELIPQVAEAYDSQLFLISDLVHIAILATHRSFIRESLATDYWTIEEIQALKKQLLPMTDLEGRWRRMTASELAGMRASLGISKEDGPVRPIDQDPPANLLLYLAPQHQLALLGDLDNLLVKTDEFGIRTQAYRDSYGKPFIDNVPTKQSLLSIPFASTGPITSTYRPAYEGVAEAYNRSLRERRWTLCALAVKEFQLKNKRWPKTLDELSDVGLSKTDRSAFPGVPFGYRVANDSSHVLLWTSSPVHTTVESEPPSTIEQHSQNIESMEIRIE